MDQAVNILIVEETNDFALINSCLHKAFKNPVLVYCRFLAKAVEINAAVAFDVLIIGLKFEQTPEKPLFARLLQKANHPAIIILTNRLDEKLTAEMILAGAQDCIDKENLNSRVLYKSITYALARRQNNLRAAAVLQEYKDLFNRNPLPVLVYELDNKKLILANYAAERFYGYSDQEFAAMHISDLQQQNQTGVKSFAGTHHHLNKKGNLILVEVVASLLQLNHKTCRLLVVIEQSEPQTNQAVISSEQQQLLLLESAINNSADGVIITKNTAVDFCNSEIVYSNPAFHQLCGYTAQELLAQTPTMVHKKHPVKEVSARTQAFGETFETRFTNYKNNKIDYWVDYSVSPVEDEHGNIPILWPFTGMFRSVKK